MQKIARPCWAVRLALIRELTGLSQPEFGQTIGVSGAAYQLYEKGKREPRIETWRKIRDTYKISLDVLLCETAEWTIIGSPPDFDPSKAQATETLRYLAIVVRSAGPPQAGERRQILPPQPLTVPSRNRPKDR